MAIVTDVTAVTLGGDVGRMLTFGVPGDAEGTAEQVTGDQRQAAKAVNFGSLYGMRPRGLAQYAKLNYGTDLSREEAALERPSCTLVIRDD